MMLTPIGDGLMVRQKSFSLGVFVGCVLLLASSLDAQVDLKSTGDNQIAITIDGKPFADFYAGASTPKPYLAPLRTASGTIVTRKYPMESVAGESRDHQHHRGLWIGYGEINGVNFWENEASYTTNNRGKIVLHGKPNLSSGAIEADFAWLDTHSQPVLNEHRKMTFAGGQNRTVDVDVTFTAAVDAHFVDTKEGFFAIRVADTIAEKGGGLMTNSEWAKSEKNIWGKPAEWVEYEGTADGQKVGIALFDHPANPNHPPRWHSRAYGLFAVNPFGVKDFDKTSTRKGGYDLAAGKSLRFRYRVIIHDGDVPPKQVADWYSDYKNSASQ